MRILMKALAAGPHFIRREGAQYDVDAAEGEALIAGGYAEPVAEPAAVLALDDRSAPIAAGAPTPGPAADVATQS